METAQGLAQAGLSGRRGVAASSLLDDTGLETRTPSFSMMILHDSDEQKSVAILNSPWRTPAWGSHGLS